MHSEVKPETWREASLREVADYINGYSFKPHHWKEHGLPIVRIAQMLCPGAALDRYPGVLSKQFRVDNGDLLFSWSATLATLLWDRGPAWLNQHIFKVVPKDGYDLNYVHQLLDGCLEGLAGKSHGTTMRHIKRSDLLPHRVVTPPLPEQSRIAEILDTIDEAIRKTEQGIAKLQQMKQGLLHDLLTRGIDENGELRDPERHPEQFKDSPLGRIPRGWELQSLGSLAIDGIANGVFKEPHRVGSGVPLVNVSNLYRGFGVDLNRCEFFDANAEEKRQFAALSGDIFFTRSSLNLTGIAHCNVLRGQVDDAVYECHLMRVRPSASRVNPVFLALWSRSMFARKFFMTRAKQTTMTTISQPDIAPLPVPLPPLAEQDAIVGCYDAVDIQVSDEQATASKLSLFKQGLMDDLLTGRVRVIIEEGST